MTKNNPHLTVNASPHLRDDDSDRRIMLDVSLALLPAAVGSVYLFGARVLPYYALAIATALVCDWLWQKSRGKRYRCDGSPLVTGLLLAMSLPGNAPLWFAAAGAVLAVIVAKECFGGIGRNIFNPAIFGRGVLRLIFVSEMTRNLWPRPDVPLQIRVDAISGATPLMLLKSGIDLDGDRLLATFLGTTGGKIGETSALLLLLGAGYLFARRIIRIPIPAAMLGTIAVLAFLFGGPSGFASGTLGTVLGHVLGGASIMGAFYMATDYSTSPATTRAQWYYGAALGVVTMLFRFFGEYSEGFTFALLIMNLTVPWFDRVFQPRVLGVGVDAEREKGKEETAF